MPHVNINVSLDSSEDDASGHHTRASLLVLATVAASLLVVVIISGNLLVITAFLTDKSLRSIANHFLVSLSCADLLVGGVIVPFYIYFYFTNEGRWYHGKALCYFFLALDVSATTTSILHLCVISADRYVAIVHPLKYPVKMTKRVAMFLIGSAWCVCLGLSYPLMYYGSVVAPVAQENTCPVPNSVSFNLVSAVLTFYLPTAIMIVLYRRIFLTARTHSRRLQNGRLELSGVGQDAMRIHRGGGGGGGSGNGKAAGNDESRPHTNLKVEYKAAKTVGLVIGAYLICWFPFFVVFAISPWCSTCNMSRAVLSWFGFVNSAVNPFIYAFTSSSFKAAFMRILRLRSSGKRRRPQTREPEVAAKYTSSQEQSETVESGRVRAEEGRNEKLTGERAPAINVQNIVTQDN